MFGWQLRPGDVIEHTEMERLRGCDRKVERTRRWRFVNRVRAFDYGRWFQHLTVTDEQGRGEYGITQYDDFDWKVVSR